MSNKKVLETKLTEKQQEILCSLRCIFEQCVENITKLQIMIEREEARLDECMSKERHLLGICQIEFN